MPVVDAKAIVFPADENRGHDVPRARKLWSALYHRLVERGSYMKITRHASCAW